MVIQAVAFAFNLKAEMAEIISLDAVRNRQSAPPTGEADYPLPMRAVTAFTRDEITQIMSFYAKQVICGRWFNYALDQEPGSAAFYFYGADSDMPAWVVKKTPSVEGFTFSLIAHAHRLCTAPTLAAVLERMQKALPALRS